MSLRAAFRVLSRTEGLRHLPQVWSLWSPQNTACNHQHDLLRTFTKVPAASNSRPTRTHAAVLTAVAQSALLGRWLHTTNVLQSSIDIVVPNMGDSVSEGTVAVILKQEGEIVKEDDVVAQIETDKVTIDVKYTSATPGKVKNVLVAENDTVSVGQAVAKVEQVDVSEANAAAAPEKASPKEQESVKEKDPIREKKPPKEDLAKPSEPASASPSPPAPKSKLEAAPSTGPPPPSGREKRPERRVKMSRLRLRVAERLKGAQNTYAMLTTFNEVDMTNLMDMRNTYKDGFLEKHNVKLGFMSAFVKAAASALVEVPSVNAVIDGDEISYREYYDISIAVATQKGLVVPVLRDVDKLSFADVEKNINLLGKKARDGTISIDDMAGGTFTISNGGVYGSMLSTPIINPPQSAILGMHNIQKRAMVVEGRVEARPIMYIALTYDHRLIDGREAVTFLKRVKEVIEDPRRLLLLV